MAFSLQRFRSARRETLSKRELNAQKERAFGSPLVGTEYGPRRSSRWVALALGSTLALGGAVSGGRWMESSARAREEARIATTARQDEAVALKELTKRGVYDAPYWSKVYAHLRTLTAGKPDLQPSFDHVEKLASLSKQFNLEAPRVLNMFGRYVEEMPNLHENQSELSGKQQAYLKHVFGLNVIRSDDYGLEGRFQAMNAPIVKHVAENSAPYVPLLCWMKRLHESGMKPVDGLLVYKDDRGFPY